MEYVGLAGNKNDALLRSVLDGWSRCPSSLWFSCTYNS